MSRAHNAYMNLSVRRSGRDDDLSPFFRTSIAGIEKHLQNVIEHRAALDLNIVDLRLHGLSISTLPDSFVLKHLAGILRLAITALITSPQDVDPLCNVIVEPLTERLPFSLLAPLLPANNIDLVLTLDSHIGITKLLLETFTRAGSSGDHEMVTAWRSFVHQYRANIFELWLKHTDTGVSEAAQRCLVAFLLSGSKTQHPEIKDFFDELVGDKTGVFDQIVLKLNERPSSSHSAASSPNTADSLVALGRVLSILPSLMPARPGTLCASKLAKLAFKADSDMSSDIFVRLLRTQTLVQIMEALFALDHKDTPLPHGATDSVLYIMNKAVTDGVVDGIEDIEAEMKSRVRPDLDNTEELKFQSWCKIVLGLNL